MPPDDGPAEQVVFDRYADSSDSAAVAKDCLTRLGLAEPEPVPVAPAENGTTPEPETPPPAPGKAVEQVVNARSLQDGRYGWTTSRYELKADVGKITLKTSVALDYLDPREEIRDQLRDRMVTVQGCMAGFFARHGVTLDLSMVPALDDPTSQTARRVFVRDMGVRVDTFNMLNWAFGINGLKLDDPSACSSITHEFGHMLGLLDEYAAPGAVRYIGENDSLMRHAHCPPEYVKFYPRHMRTMLAPLCPN